MKKALLLLMLLAGCEKPADDAWHYCRLTEVVAEESFL